MVTPYHFVLALITDLFSRSDSNANFGPESVEKKGSVSRALDDVYSCLGASALSPQRPRDLRYEAADLWAPAGRPSRGSTPLELAEYHRFRQSSKFSIFALGCSA